ncbi:MAG: hypothetical protein JSW41_05470 [Candidatus Aenigmatarchaeota archaeon]|nr:MAG: hypothetical protein JSW41_05470 [Candidatus Aenigmarchaeota archaeon]
MVDINAVYEGYVTYVFGDITLASLGFLFIITLIGLRFNWGLEAFLVVLTPTILLVLNTTLAIGLQPLMLIGMGLLMGFGLLALLRR